MATTIQLKRGLNENLDTATLLVGEPAFVTDTGKLYVGDGTEKVLINPIDKPVGIDTANSHTKYKVNDYGQIIETQDLTADDIPTLSISKITGLGTAATYTVGYAANNLPNLDAGAKLPLSVIPELTIDGGTF